ncbi:MAG: hypothetical protein N4A76_12030 [Firmicutes bacterium]|jgi:uncharacterized protein YuzE|nr:hypothetical protein [Bacillota bacterium]
MKKFIYILAFAIILIILHNILKSPFDDAVVVSKSRLQFDDEKRTVYLIAMDYIEEEDRIKGKYFIVLADGKKIIDRQEAIYYYDFWINRKEELIFQDIDEDGSYECFLGFENPYDESEMNYLAFKVSDDKVEKMEIEDDLFISSSQNIDKEGFEILEKGLFYTYDREPDEGENIYKISKYKIDGNMIDSKSEMVFEGNPEDINPEYIEKIMERLYKINYHMSKKALIENEDSLYFDVEENYKWINLYQYINDDCDKFYGDNNYRLYEIIRNIENVNLQFKDINIESLSEMKYDEFISIENKERDFVRREKTINGYTIFYGGFHLDSYIILFDENGEYLDSLVWTDKTRNDVSLIVKDNKMFIYPVIRNDMFYYGKEMTELSIVKDRLVKGTSKLILLDCCPDPLYGYTYSMEALDDLEKIISGNGKYRFAIAIGDDDFFTDRIIDFNNISYGNFNWDFIDGAYDSFIDSIMVDLIRENRNVILKSLENISEDYSYDYINLLNILKKSCDDKELERILIEKIQNISIDEYEKNLIEKIINGGK